MKKILIEEPFRPFFVTALVSAVLAAFLKLMQPEALFDINLFNTDITISRYVLWMWFSAYLFVLAGIYYLIERSRLKTKRLLVITHYVFILLFLVFFVLFNAFGSEDTQKIIGNIPLSAFLSIYALIFVLDAAFFLMGIVFFIVNLFSLKK